MDERKGRQTNETISNCYFDSFWSIKKWKILFKIKVSSNKKEKIESH